MIIGLDIGSSSVKAILLDARGSLRRAARVRFPTRRAASGRVEHDPAALLRAARAALQGAAAGVAAGGSAALGIAVQRSTVLFWDKDSGRAVTPAYSWQDLRAAPLCRSLRERRLEPRRRGASGLGGRGLEEEIVRRTGLRLSAHYAAGKLAWAMRRVPGLRRRVAGGRVLWGTLGAWLAWHLTRGGLYAIDHANAQRTLLLDLESLSWDTDLFDLFGLSDLLDAPALPALLPTRLAGGAEASIDGRRLVLRAMTGDQQAALQGLLCRRAGDMAINYGSGAFVLMQVGQAPMRVPGLLTTLVDSRPAAGNTEGRATGCIASFAVEGTVNAAATALDWVASRIRRRIRTAGLDRLLGPYDPADHRAIHFLPAVSGLGAPRWDERARPRFAGRLAGAGAREVMRSAVESIAQRCAEIALLAEQAAARRAKAGAQAPIVRAAVRVSGGLTRCRYLLQAQADLLQRDLVVTASRDATALGAALLAAEDGGRSIVATLAGRAMQETLRPLATPSRAAALRRAWGRALYGRAGGGAA